MIFMTGLIIAIKDNGYLALASIAVQIYILHIHIQSSKYVSQLLRKVPKQTTLTSQKDEAS